MQRLCVLTCLCLLATLARAAFQAVPVACNPETAILATPITASEAEFHSCPRGAGIVSDHAVMTDIAIGEYTLRLAFDTNTLDAKRFTCVRWKFTKSAFEAKHTAPMAFRVNSRGIPTYHFGPATVTLPDGKTTLSISGRFLHAKFGAQLDCYAANALEARGIIGGKPHVIRIVDGNHNLRLGDPAAVTAAQQKGQQLRTGDTVVIDPTTTAWRGPYGSPALIDGNWYHVNLTGATIAITPLSLPSGTMQLAHDRWSAIFVGTHGYYQLSGGRKPIPLPVDQYAVVDYRELGKLDAQGRQATLTTGMLDGQPKTLLAVRAHALTRVVIGSPVTATLEVNKSANSFMFKLALKDAAGHQPKITLADGSRPAAPEVQIVTPKGEEVARFTCEYG